MASTTSIRLFIKLSRRERDHLSISLLPLGFSDRIIPGRLFQLDIYLVIDVHGGLHRALSLGCKVQPPSYLRLFPQTYIFVGTSKPFFCTTCSMPPIYRAVMVTVSSWLSTLCESTVCNIQNLPLASPPPSLVSLNSNYLAMQSIPTSYAARVLSGTPPGCDPAYKIGCGRLEIDDPDHYLGVYHAVRLQVEVIPKSNG